MKTEDKELMEVAERWLLRLLSRSVSSMVREDQQLERVLQAWLRSKNAEETDP